MCNCGPHVKIQEYQNQEVVDIPPHMESYRLARRAAGLTELIGIDRCILPEIRWLWALGVHTHGSCCGHNVSPSMVNVREEDDALMVAMGYFRWPWQPPGMCHETFFLKTVIMSANSPMLMPRGLLPTELPNVPKAERSDAPEGLPEGPNPSNSNVTQDGAQEPKEGGQP